MAEPSPKKARTEWDETLAKARDEALSKHSRDEMLRSLFNNWDRDGNGEVGFDELLPHYMKASNHNEEMEAEVRAGFEKFMAAKGKDPKTDCLSFELFSAWLKKSSDAQLATQYVKCVEGLSREPYAMNVDKAVIKEYEGKPLKEILEAPITAIQGLGDFDAAACADLGLKTIRDLGSWKFYLLARAIHTLSEKEEHGDGTSGKMNIRGALDPEHESKTLKQVLALNPVAFNMLPASASEHLSKLKITTIDQLARRKAFAWANAMVELEKYEQ